MHKQILCTIVLCATSSLLYAMDDVKHQPGLHVRKHALPLCTTSICNADEVKKNQIRTQKNMERATILAAAFNRLPVVTATIKPEHILYGLPGNKLGGIPPKIQHYISSFYSHAQLMEKNKDAVALLLESKQSSDKDSLLISDELRCLRNQYVSHAPSFSGPLRVIGILVFESNGKKVDSSRSFNSDGFSNLNIAVNTQDGFASRIWWLWSNGSLTTRYCWANPVQLIKTIETRHIGLARFLQEHALKNGPEQFIVLPPYKQETFDTMPEKFRENLASRFKMLKYEENKKQENVINCLTTGCFLACFIIFKVAT